MVFVLKWPGPLCPGPLCPRGRGVVEQITKPIVDLVIKAPKLLNVNYIIVVILKILKIDLYETKDKMIPKYNSLTFYVFAITMDDIQNRSIKTK